MITIARKNLQTVIKIAKVDLNNVERTSEVQYIDKT